MSTSKQELIDAAERLRAKIQRDGPQVGNREFWYWDRAYWLAARALDQLGCYGLLPRDRLDYHIEQATYMMRLTEDRV